MRSRLIPLAIPLALAAAACSSSSGGKTIDLPSVTVDTPSAPSVAQVKTWPTAWCQAQPGMTREQLRALMGPPTSEASLADGNPQMSWDFAEYQFNAFMDVNDKVRQLDVNDIELTPAEKAAIHCATTRR